MSNDYTTLTALTVDCPQTSTVTQTLMHVLIRLEILDYLLVILELQLSITKLNTPLIMVGINI